MSWRLGLLIISLAAGYASAASSATVGGQQQSQQGALPQLHPAFAITPGSGPSGPGRRLLGTPAEVAAAAAPGASLGRRLAQYLTPWVQQWAAPGYATTLYSTPGMTGSSYYGNSASSGWVSYPTTTYLPVTSTEQDQELPMSSTTDWLPTSARVESSAGSSSSSNTRRGRPQPQRQQQQPQPQQRQQQLTTTPVKPTLPSLIDQPLMQAAAPAPARPAASFIPASQSAAAPAVTAADASAPSPAAAQPAAAAPALQNAASTTPASRTAAPAVRAKPARGTQRKRPAPQQAAAPAATAAPAAAAGTAAAGAAAAAVPGAVAVQAAAVPAAAAAPTSPMRTPRKWNTGAPTSTQRQQQENPLQQQQLDATQLPGDAATLPAEAPPASSDKQQQQQQEQSEPPAAQLQPEPVPSQEPPSPPPAEPEKYCIPWKWGDHFRVLTAGDSITQGSVPSQNRNWPYAIRLTSLLKEKVGLFAKAIDAGLGGGGIFMTGFNNPITFPPFINSYLSQGSWDVVVIMIGINDLLRGGKPAADIMGGLTPIVNDVLAKGTPVILIPPLAAPGFVDQADSKEAERKKLAGLMKDLAAQKAAATNGVGPQVYALDLQSGPLEFYGMSQSERSKYLDDGLHLSTAGYDAIGELVFQEINSHLCPK